MSCERGRRGDDFSRLGAVRVQLLWRFVRKENERIRVENLRLRIRKARDLIHDSRTLDLAELVFHL